MGDTKERDFSLQLPHGSQLSQTLNKQLKLKMRKFGGFHYIFTLQV